jgi:hypothetical protein
MDAADRPFDFGLTGGVYRDVELVVSDAGAAIEARATDARHAAVTAFSLVVFPTSRDLWFPDSRHLKASLSGQVGSARVTGLPPGDYYVAAVDRFQLFPSGGELSDPDVLEQLSRGVLQVSLNERERRTLTPAPVPPSGQPTLNRDGPSNVSTRWNLQGGWGVIAETTVGPGRATQAARTCLRRVWHAGGGA